MTTVVGFPFIAPPFTRVETKIGLGRRLRASSRLLQFVLVEYLHCRVLPHIMILVQVILQLAVAVEGPLGSSYSAQEALDNVLDQFSRTRIAIGRDLPRDKKGLRQQFVCLNGIVYELEPGKPMLQSVLRVNQVCTR